MEALNRAYEGARSFTDLMEKTTGGKRAQVAATPPAEIADWNAEVDRKAAAKAQEKELRRRAMLLDAEREAFIARTTL